MRSALSKVQTVKSLDLKLTPPTARFKMDTAHVSLQDVVIAIRKAGDAFDGKLTIEESPTLTQAQLDKLDDALSAVRGVKNTGYPDSRGRRVLTFDLKERTLFADIVGAGKSVGVDLETPKPDKK